MVKQTSNAYFFEISNMPVPAQMDLRARLRKKGVEIPEYRNRSGSGAVPNKMQRGIAKMARKMASAFGSERSFRKVDIEAKRAEFMAQQAKLDSLPLSEQAAFLFPGNPSAQAIFNEEMALISAAKRASVECAPEYPPPEQVERTIAT
jgi:hypothetical protein